MHEGPSRFRGGSLSGVSAYCGVKTREIVEVSGVLDRLLRKQSRDSRSVGCSRLIAVLTAER